MAYYSTSQLSQETTDLNHSLLSQVAEEDSLNTNPNILDLESDPNKKTSKTQKDPDPQKYSQHQIPARLDLAELYWESTGIGYKDPHQPSEIKCPSSLYPRLKKYPIFTNPLKIQGFGTTIQVYFLFTLCCFVLVLTEFLSIIYLALLLRGSRCREKKEELGDCSIFNLDTYKLPDIKFWFRNDTQEVKNQAGLAYMICYFSNFDMYGIIFFFVYLKVKMRLKYKETMTESIPSEFTIMVEGVDTTKEQESKTDNQVKKEIVEFIRETFRQESDQELKIEKVLIAKASGIIQRTKNQLEESLKELKAIEVHKKMIKVDISSDEAKKKKVIFEGLENLERKKIEKLTKLVKKLKKRKSF